MQGQFPPAPSPEISGAGCLWGTRGRENGRDVNILLGKNPEITETSTHEIIKGQQSHLYSLHSKVALVPQWSPFDTLSVDGVNTGEGPYWGS